MALRLTRPSSEDAAMEQNATGTGEPLAAARAAGGAPRDRCLKMHENLCDPSSGNRAVLVTAHGGSGTHSLSALLEMNGMDLPHESVGEGGSVSWPYAVDVGHTAFAGHDCVGSGGMDWLKPPQPSGTHFRNVYHVVRCPVDVISSTASWLDPDDCSMKYMDATLKLGWSDPFDQGDLRFWARAWLAQNEFIESYAQRTFTLDQFSDLFQQVCKDTGLSYRMCERATLPTAGRRTHPDITWVDLTARVGAELVAELRSAALRYGFGEDCLEDAARAKERPLTGGQLLTHGVPGAKCDGKPGRDCTDGLDWVWEASVVERIKRSGLAPFRAAWAAV